MGGKKREVSDEIRNLIIGHFKDGKSERAIAEIVKINKSTVHDIISCFKKSGSIEKRPRSGRPRIFSDREERWIVNEVKKNPKTSAVKLTGEAGKRFNKSSNPETIRNILRKNEFHGRVARRKPYISKVNRQKRLHFAQEHINKPWEFWRRVLFADESKYNIFGPDERGMVWRKPNTELELQNLRCTVKHGGGSQMVWGCMSASGVGNLHLIDGNVDKYVYLNILKGNLKQSASKLGILDNFQFYEDNDPKNKADIHLLTKSLCYYKNY